MKVAFACWDNRIAPVFDTARRIHIARIESGRIVDETRESLPEDVPVRKALHLVELGIGTVVCGAISRTMNAVVASYGIRIIPFVAGDLQDVIQAWLGETLEREVFAMPGCRGRRGWGFGHGHGAFREVEVMNGRGRGMGPGGGRGRGMGAGSGRGQGGAGRGRMGGPAAGGPEGSCVCSRCGHAEPHQRGVPCSEIRCPKCGAPMTRQ